VFQSGKRAGKAIELLMFTDYDFLIWLLRKLDRESGSTKNTLHLHLEWLIQKGENRQTKMICPQCKKQPVKFFSVRYAGDLFSIGSSYTCCKKEECIEKVRAMAAGKWPELLPFRFSVMGNFRLKADKRRIGILFRRVFGLPNPLTREAAFEFFNSSPP